MTDKYRAMVLGSFCGDALALGTHWIYDTDVIQKNFGRVENITAPPPDSYHPSKTKGDFTHYGDQTLLLLRSIHPFERFNLAGFGEKWQKMMNNYNGYVDKASRVTLDNLAETHNFFESGSSSTDLGGPARIAPLLFSFRTDIDLCLSHVKEQTAMTHNSPTALISAEVLCRITWDVLQGKTPKQAVDNVLELGVGDITLDMRIRNTQEEKSTNTTEIIKQCGQACGADSGLPGVIHLITTYEDDLERALIENVMAGGDSAARGLVAGMILGAHLGLEAVPDRWLSQLNALSEITDLLDGY